MGKDQVQKPKRVVLVTDTKELAGVVKARLGPRPFAVSLSPPGALLDYASIDVLLLDLIRVSRNDVVRAQKAAAQAGLNLRILAVGTDIELEPSARELGLFFIMVSDLTPEVLDG